MKLPTYTAPGVNLPISGGRAATGADFGADANIGQIVQGQAKGLLDYVGEDEARKALIGSTEVRAKYAQALDQAAIDGSDLDKIKEQMNNDLAKIGDKFGTKKGVESLQLYTANSNIMFDQQANAVKMHKAGAEAKLDAGKWLNSTAALINTQPTYLQTALQDADTLAHSYVNIPVEKRDEIAAQLKNELNLSAAIAAGRNDPKGTLDKLAGGAWDLTPEQRLHATHNATVAWHAQRADEEHARVQADKDKHDLSESAGAEIFKKIRTGNISEGEIINDGRLSREQLEHQVNNLDAYNREIKHGIKPSDEGEKNRLWLRYNAPDGTPGKLYNTDEIYKSVAAHARGEPGLNIDDANKLLMQVGGNKDENNKTFASRLYGRISSAKSFMMMSPEYQVQPLLADAIANELVSQVEKKSVDMRKANINPDGLLDPDSKDYFFTPNRTKQIAEDVKKQMRASMPSVTDLRQTPDAAAKVPVGTPFIDPKGVSRIMTKELLDKLGAPKAPAENLLRSPVEKQVDQLYGKQPATPASNLPPAAPAPFVKAVPAEPTIEPKAITDIAVAASAGEAFLSGNKPKPVDLSAAEKKTVLKEIEQYKAVWSDAKKTEAQRDNAMKEIARRLLRLGVSRKDIETTLRMRTPLSSLGL